MKNETNWDLIEGTKIQMKLYEVRNHSFPTAYIKSDGYKDCNEIGRIFNDVLMNSNRT